MTIPQEEMRLLLSLSKLFALRYSVSKGFFELFQVMESGSADYIYQGELDDWSKENEKAVGKEYLQDYCHFIADLKAGEEAFRYRVPIAGTLYAVNCVLGEDGDMVYGTLQAEKNLGRNKSLLFRRESDKDPMLDMLNKRAITEYAQNRMTKKKSSVTYLVILDLDNFKTVNDTFGHPFGDRILVTCTEIINRAVGNHGMVGRIGGDEILIVTKDISSKAELRPFLREIRMNIEMTYKGKLNGISLTCSMGAAAFPLHGESYDAVMELADRMLYLAKDKGRNRYIIYTPEMHSDVVLKDRISAVNYDNVVMTYNKTEIMHFMLSEFLVHQRTNNQFAFTQIGNTFKLNEVLCIYDKGSVGYRWVAGDNSKGIQDDDYSLVRADQDFYSYFDRNSLFIMDALFDLDEKDSELQQRLRERHVESAIFYRLKQNGMPSGYMMFAKYYQRQKWSEYEILALATIAKIFELSIDR